MYLQKLKLKGFKSFSDDVELTFTKGITAIVGPNGSGKSNIADAVRFVLGEQSTKLLRSKKMEDVIFSGTENKSPMGYAEVRLLLNNEEQTQSEDPQFIEILRRLYRTTESEYRINNKNCKRKDIYNLFMDTGVGKSGYSLISQGKIESIINSTPKELRSIVEEAVGIVNYRTAKEDAEKKLDKTKENMDRLLDIIEELQKQIKPLEKQSKTAKAYLEIYEALKHIDLLLFCQSYTKGEKTLKELKTYILQAERNIQDEEIKIKALDQKFQEHKTQLQNLNKDQEQREIALENQQKTLQQTKEIVLLARERIQGLEIANKKQIQEKEEYDQTYLEICSKIQDLKTEINNKQEAIKSSQIKLDHLTQNKNEIQKEILKSSQILQKRNKEIEDKKYQRDLLQGQLNYTKEQIHIKEKDLESLLESKEEKQENVQQLNLDSHKMQEEMLAKKTEASQLQKNLQRDKEAYQLLVNNHQVNQAQQNYLENIKINYKDYFTEIQVVMKSPEISSKIGAKVFGPVGELVTIPPKLTKAIEVALGGKIQNIVVDSLKTAHHCIGVLKKQKAGRATFLPLDNLQIKTISQQEHNKIKTIQGVCGLASELIEYNPKYQDAIKSILGRTIIVEDFPSAEAVRTIFKSYTIVTLDGEVFYSGGAVVGGTIKGKKSSPLSKKTEVLGLKQDAEIISQKINAITQVIQEKSALLVDLEKDIKTLEKQGLENEKALWRFKEKNKNNEERKAQLIKSIKDLQLEIEKKEKETTLLDSQIQELKQFLNVENKDDIPKTQGDLNEITESINANQIQLIKKQEEERGLKQRKTLLDEQKEQIYGKITQLEAEIKRQKDQIKEQKNIFDTGNISQDNAKSNVLLLQGEKEDLKSKSKILDQELEVLNQKIREANHRFVTENDGKSNWEIQKAKIEEKITYEEQEIYSRYEMNYLMARDYVELKPDPPSKNPKTEQMELRRKIEALGYVNINAIEDYKAVFQRLDFLDGQYQDLEKGKTELENIIKKLYQSMEGEFAQGFLQLQENFENIFSILFEGGTGKLQYVDESKILESGIELVVQPPGKKLKHINLLSGGEKSMTAIALLFSFLELSPSPFCIIDEIDAALDDYNIFRFTNYLKKISQKNQFIIITHRKNTLEVCDIIYGVTMSKSGISKLVSIRLEDYIKNKA